MATIESYVTSTGAKRYMVRYRTPQRTQTKKRGFRTKRDAQEFASTVEVEKITGTYASTSLGMITVGELAPAWLSRKESDVAPSNYRTLESAWRIHVEPAWATTRVADVDLAAAQRWIAIVRKTCASISISSGVNVLALSRMLEHQAATVTLDTYADLFDTDLDAVALALDLKCAQSVPKPPPAATPGA